MPDSQSFLLKGVFFNEASIWEDHTRDGGGASSGCQKGGARVQA